MSRQKIDQVYWERNQLVAFLTSLFPSYVGDDPDNPDWPVVYVETVKGQLSWHVSKGEAERTFGHLPRTIENVWDGHSTEEKYERLKALRLYLHEVLSLLSGRPAERAMQGM